jgi:hypothetical protein
MLRRGRGTYMMKGKGRCVRWGRPRAQAMKIRSSLFAALLLLAAIPAVACAAPAISGSELPGRDRLRFQESPVERFMQPTREAEPLIRWQCDPDKPRAKKKKQQRGKRTAC